MAARVTDALADELYGLTPAEFTRARNDAAKAADKPERDRIMALKKPSVAAWVVNLLVRQRPDQIEQILELGEQLREAQGDLDRDALAELGRQRRQLVGALAKNGAALADVAGHKVSNAVVDEVAQTLQAGMVDADAAAAVRAGRLVRSLEALGLTVDLDGAIAGDAVAATPKSKRDPVVDELEEKRAEKRRREVEAQRAAEAAETEHEKAERVVADALRRRDSIADRVADAASALTQLKAELAAAENDLKAASTARDDAADAAAKARRDL